MTNEEKTMLLLEEVCNDEFGEVVSDKNWTPCNLTCRQVRKKIEYACINIARWKDEQIKQQLNSLKDEIQSNLCASSGFNDEYSHGYQDCGMKVMEMIDKILEL